MIAPVAAPLPTDKGSICTIPQQQDRGCASGTALVAATATETQRMKEEENLWDIWEDDTIVPWKPRDAPKQIVAPKRDLPTHAESYNPPEEYLFDENEKAQFEDMEEAERPYNYLPQKFQSLRKVPMY